MELEGGNPSPALIRSLILNLEIKEPVVFRQIHKDWNPVNWNLEQLGNILSVDEGQLLPCHFGKINGPSPDPQSQTGTKLLSWDSMTSWSSADEWIYFDYKNMRDVVDVKYLQEFEWSRLGFPERNGDKSNLWIGSAGSFTPCHFDTYGCNLVAQVRGRKRWLLFPLEETPHLRPTRVPYEESSVFSQIKFSQPSAEAIRDLRGLDVFLEPGDVLYVPPKWWHFVQSQDFSISVNTWIEMPNDAEMRVEEGIMRSLVAAFVSVSSPDTAVHLLNPNEEELLDMTEVQIQEFLQSSATDLFFQKSTQVSRVTDENNTVGEEVRGPPEKKSKLDSSRTPALADLLTQCDRVTRLPSFHPVTYLANHHDRQTEAALPKEHPNYIVHLINALGHPDVMKVLRDKFLENCSHADNL